MKENALDALDLPFQIKHGRIGILSASIPWSSLYTSPVIFKLSNVLVIAAPNVDFSTFDEDKAIKAAQLAKQKLLQSIEEAFQKQKEKEKIKKSNSKEDKESKDDFVTKLTAQIIKNVQIRIDKVHVRFEDKFTDPLIPYVAGITLDQILFETQAATDKASKYEDATSDDIIYKLVSLKCFSVYWNVLKVKDEDRQFISYIEDVEERESRLLETVATENYTPSQLDYIFKPITFTADAMINRKPHVDDFNVPVLDIDVLLDDFKLGFHRKQFESLLLLLDSFGRMKLALPHRRWRPTVPIHGHSKKWWSFAITAIHENEVKRKSREWSWNHIKNHRMRMREYLEVYKDKLLKPKNKSIAERATELENDLDVFNIVLIRRQAESAVKPQLKQMEAEREEKKKKKGGSWWSGWWGSSSDETDSPSDAGNVIEDFKKEMTQEEKDKLYEAIGYGDSALTDYPVDFAAHLLSLKLNSIVIVLVDDVKFGGRDAVEQKILEMSLLDMETNIQHRPASNGFLIRSSVDDLSVIGKLNRPLIREETPEKAFTVEFISNPVNQEFDFGVTLKTNPLHFVYDALTVNSLIDMFNKPSDVSLEQIQELAEDRISRLKKMSATGLEYAISKHRDININIDFAPFFLIIPHDDKVWDDDEEEDDEFKDALTSPTKPSDCLIVCFGRVQLNSLSADFRKKSLDVRHLSKQETPESLIAIARERAYESYKLRLSEVQVILSSSSTWKNDIGFNRGKKYQLHVDSHALLHPTCLDIDLQRCIINDDPDLPKFKVKAVIPLVSIVASGIQLVKSLSLLMELPTPVTSSTDEVESSMRGVRPSDLLTATPIRESDDHWFLKKVISEAVEVTEETDLTPVTEIQSQSSKRSDASAISNKDQLVLQISAVKVVLETGGVNSRPILRFETSLMGKLDGWTKLTSSVTLSMTYYNERVMAWEPVIEPIDGSGKAWCTELKAEIGSGNEDDNEPKVSASLESHERLELTISKTFLDVVSRLGEAFAKAAKMTERHLKPTDVTVVTNSMGVDMMIIVDKNKYSFDWMKVVSEYDYATIILHPNDRVELTRLSLRSSNEDKFEDETSDFIARIVVDEKEINRNIALKSKSKKVFEIPVIRYPVSRLRWVLNVDIQDFGNKKVTFGTPIEMINNLQRVIDIYKLDKRVVPSDAGGEIVTETAVKLASVDPLSTWYLPISLVFSETDLIFISAGEDYCIPNQGIAFKDLEQSGRSVLVKCEPKTDDRPCVNLIVISTVQDVLYEETSAKIAKCITLEVNPTLIFQNLLPMTITYTLPLCSDRTLRQGEKHQLGQFDPFCPTMDICIPNYLGMAWVCSRKVDIRNFDEDDVNLWSFVPVTSTVDGQCVSRASSPQSPSKKQPAVQCLVLAMSLSKPYPSKPVIAQLFAPFWLVNRTGMKLTLRSGDIIWYHHPDSTLPLLFSFKAGKLFKQKMNMRIHDSVWSDSFSIDAVGNQGNIFCRGKDRDNKMTYCVSIDIALSSFSLTKIVTFSPFYSVVNRTNIFVEVSDDNSSWVPVNATSKVSFWPKDAASGKLFVKSGEYISSPVTFKESNSTLVAVGSELFNVLVDVTDSGIKIQLSDYDEGSCPVRIFNSTRRAMEFWQQGCHHKTILNPFHSVYFLWTEPTGARQLILKKVASEDPTEQAIVELTHDVFGAIDKKDAPSDTFWVSFLDGRQRTLLITSDVELTTAALQAAEFTKPNVTLDICMKGMGISIVNDENQQDLIYLGVSGTDTVWEVKKPKSKRFKTLQLRQIEIIEAAYQRELTRLHIERQENLPPRTTSTVQLLANKIMLDMNDINNLVILQPMRGILRRHAAPGFYARVILSDHVIQTHAKIARVQIDNQQENCLFNIIMCPVTPPKSVSQDRAPKPFIEFSSVLQRTANLNRFKYVSVLVQEFLVQIDGAFLLSMTDFLGQSSDSIKEVDYEKLIAKDVKQLIDSEVIDDENEVILSKAYYDLIHFSPIKVHVSFSLGGISSFQIFGVLDLLMRSAGVTLTEFKDVTFKVDFFERKNILLDNQQLISQATTHYIRQVLKQFYVIVLGLDVIGNPVGLVLGLTQGVGDFFYEPLMGIIEGPEEFAEGLALGVKSLFSHTFGGAAGALSKITGTLGEGVSALTMDDEFIRRRRLRMQRKQNVADSGKELAQGFWRGLSGIIRKPIEGARDDGFEGLFKGLGKGAVGVLVQPATGVIDFASGSLGALKRAVDINQEAKQQRPPRFFQPDNILRPYNRHEATGHQMLQSLDKGSYSESDNYQSHCTLKHPANVSKELIVIITDLRIFVLKESCLYSTWEVEWKESFADIKSIDIHNLSVIKFVLRVSSFYLFGFTNNHMML